jgi:hypothetical protein
MIIHSESKVDDTHIKIVGTLFPIGSAVANHEQNQNVHEDTSKKLL